jgi:hypothetical protein
MLPQMCLAPLWKAYDSLDAGADIGDTLSRMIAKLNLVQVHTRLLVGGCPDYACGSTGEVLSS